MWSSEKALITKSVDHDHDDGNGDDDNDSEENNMSLSERVHDIAAQQWAERYCEQSSLMIDTSIGQNVGYLMLHNSSHACYKKARASIVMGYLRRKYRLTGKIKHRYDLN